ncbi:MAG TPA: hypothetical protein DF610_07225 [Sphingobacterium sp.]|nr:hypothetical protein [Sphingobacterium sp.]
MKLLLLTELIPKSSHDNALLKYTINMKCWDRETQDLYEIKTTNISEFGIKFIMSIYDLPRI